MRFRIPVTGRIVQQVADVDHFRGLWGEGAALPPERREELLAASSIRSTAAACRLAGMRPTEDEVRAALAGDRDRAGAAYRDLVGYHRALSAPLPTADRLLDADAMRSLHATLLGAEGPDPEPTPWRRTQADPEAFDADGRALGRVFVTLPPRLVPETMQDLTTWLEFELRSREHHALLVIGTFCLGILAANPFDRGNLRLALVLATRILTNHGYGFIRCASIEELVEARREALYDAYDTSQTRLWTGESDLAPWLDFFMERLREQAEAVRRVLEAERHAETFSPLQRAIVETVREHGTAEAGLLIRELGANRNTLKDNLRRLVDRGVLEKMGERRGTRYRIAAPQATRMPGV